MAKKKIGVKYCGGCNPNYERVEMMGRVRSLVGERFLFLRYDQEDLDGMIHVNGCPRACAANHSNQREGPCYSISGKDDLDSLIEWLNTR
jgi:hypothetical protein